MPQKRWTPLKRVNPSGKTRWVARYPGPDGKTRSAGTFRLEREAQDAIDRAMEVRTVPGTVGEYLERWLVEHPRSPRTNKTNEGRIRAVLDVQIEGVRLRDWPFADLRRRQANALLGHMLTQQGRASTGATNILRALSAMAEDAITDEIAGTNAFKGVRVRASDPRVTKAIRKPRILSWEEMHAFAAAAGAHEPMIRMLADCGLRIGELLALRRALQDLRSGVFTVEGSAYEGEVVQSSSEKQHDRQGPIPPTCLALLRGMPTRIDTPWLFPTPTGRLWQINNLYRDVWRPARVASGIDATPQDFRHSWNSLLLAAGVDRRDLADIAGHSEEVNAKRYTHGLGQSFDRVRSVIG